MGKFAAFSLCCIPRSQEMYSDRCMVAIWDLFLQVTLCRTKSECMILVWIDVFIVRFCCALDVIP